MTRRHSSWYQVKRGFAREFNYGPKAKHRRVVLRARFDRHHKWRQRIYNWTRYDIG